MTNKRFSMEFIYQIFALIIATLAVHTAYVTLIRPEAEQILADEAARVQEDANYVSERSIYVLVKDVEQETCFILLLWAFAIMGIKAWSSLKERELLNQDLVPISEGMTILPEDTREYARQIQALPGAIRNLLLPRTLLTALHRFNSTRNIQDVSAATLSLCESEAERLESELSMIRYIAWAIPSVGFIGTVRGIGQALAQAHQATNGDITAVTNSLGVAFNSTYIALILSIILMFLVFQLQHLQERLVFETQNYCDEKLLRHLQVR